MTFTKAKKSLGQHFLTSGSAIDKMIDASHVNPDDIVLEIGPGKGILTEKLIKLSGRVIALEKDSCLIPYLSEKFADGIKKGKLDIMEKDVLEFDPELLRFYQHPYKIVANIPYYITGEIIRKFLTAEYKPESMTLLVQKEVAERIVARDKKESILSLSVKFFGQPTYIATVKRGSFNPQPKVDSAILHIERIEIRDKRLEKRFFELVKTGFKSKRKKLISNLSSLFDKSQLAPAFVKLSLDENTRAEDVPLETWLELSNSLNMIDG
jgi:16S rRNA (adenine1518-N6/adenine1519-N6)-dimethyltransferase